MYDWILYIFKKGSSKYLVPSESLEYAWESLRSRQSISMERLKSEYDYIGAVDGSSRIRKLK